VEDENHVVADANGLEPGIEIALMISQVVRPIRSGWGNTHSDKIRSETTT
jgi:hypothetical protein